MNGAVPQSSATRVPATAVTSRSSPTRLHESRATTGSAASGSVSAWAAPVSPATFRANSTVMYWNPPQVPRIGIPAVRARRIASSTASSSRYGVPGTTQTPSAAAADSASGLGSQRASTSAGRSASVASISRWVSYSTLRSPRTAIETGMA